MPPTLQKPSVQLAAVLMVAGVLAILLSTGEPAAAVRQRAPGERKAMMEIEANDLQGRRWRLKDHRGEVVLVNVWATWCPPCRAETPALVKTANAYRGKGLEILGVSMDEGAVEVRGFVDRYHVPYSIVFPPADSPLNSVVEALPTSYLIDKSGRVAAVYQGAVTQSELTSAVDALLQER